MRGVLKAAVGLTLCLVAVNGWGNAKVNAETGQIRDVTLVKQGFSNKLNIKLNDRINGSLVASYIYTSMSFWFDRADMALPGFHKFFHEMADKAREDAGVLMKYINKRGGTINLKKIKAPPKRWTNGLKAMEESLGLERELNGNMLRTHQFADPHASNFIEDRFLEPKVDLIKKLGDFVTRLKSFQTKSYSLGEYILDKDLLD